ncbi:methyltransferase [Bacteroidia bacterium]|nr:methyltransferase [Bacteroidia bacterium]GHV22236.1 methyltransferase [Bacteroidia bacterium]
MNIVKKQRAPQNRTLELTREEFSRYQSGLLEVSSPVSLGKIKNRTIHGDLQKIMDFFPENFADLIIIDPPYNLSKDFSGMKFSRMKENLYLDYLRSWFPRIVSFLKPDGSLYLCGDWKCTSALQTVMSEYLSVLNRITWQREKGRGAKANWKNSMEDIWFGVKDPNNYYFDIEPVKIKRKVIAPYTSGGIPKDWEQTAEGNFRVTHPSNFWDDITVPYWSMPENTDHPTQKPEKLIAKLILASCPPGGMIFDPFLGSGTTSVVAKKLGRNYCGVEINPEYCCWAEKRLDNADKNPEIQGFSNGVFWERNSRP